MADGDDFFVVELERVEPPTVAFVGLGNVAEQGDVSVLGAPANTSVCRFAARYSARRFGLHGRL